MVGNKAILPRHLFKIRPGYEVIICFTYCKQSKLEVGEVLLRGCESRNAGLISFQDQVSYSHGRILQLVSYTDPLPCEQV